MERRRPRYRPTITPKPKKRIISRIFVGETEYTLIGYVCPFDNKFLVIYELVKSPYNIPNRRIIRAFSDQHFEVKYFEFYATTGYTGQELFELEQGVIMLYFNYERDLLIIKPRYAKPEEVLGETFETEGETELF